MENQKHMSIDELVNPRSSHAVEFTVNETLSVCSSDNNSQEQSNVNDQWNIILKEDQFEVITEDVETLSCSVFGPESNTSSNSSSLKDIVDSPKHVKKLRENLRPTRQCKTQMMNLRDFIGISDEEANSEGSDWEHEVKASKVTKFSRKKCYNRGRSVSDKGIENPTPTSDIMPLISQSPSLYQGQSRQLHFGHKKTVNSNHPSPKLSMVSNVSSNEKNATAQLKVSSPSHHLHKVNTKLSSVWLDNNQKDKVTRAYNNFASVCNKCGKVFTTYVQYIQHVRHTVVCGNKRRPYQEFLCHLCGKEFRREYYLERHLNKHLNRKPHICEDCGKCFLTTREKSMHNIRVHKRSPSELSFLCIYCGYMSQKKYHLLAHEAAHEVPEGKEVPKPYKCQKCEKAYMSKLMLSRHMADRHLQKKCHLCLEMCPNKSKLKTHLKQVHGVLGESVKCAICDKSYYKNNLRNHMQIVHTPPKFFCDICEKGFKKKAQIEQHLITHSDHRPIACDQCGDRFKRKTHLKQHLEARHGGNASRKRSVERKKAPAKRGRKKKIVD